MSAEHDAPAAVHESTAAPPQVEAPVSPLSEAPLAVPASSAPALLSDPHIEGRGNAPVRQAALQQMQRTYGNRATQRFLQRAPAGTAEVPVAEPATRPA